MLARLDINLTSCVAYLCNVSHSVFSGGPGYAGRASLGLVVPKYSAEKMKQAILDIHGTDQPILVDEGSCKWYYSPHGLSPLLISNRSYVVCYENNYKGKTLSGPRYIASFNNPQPHFQSCTLWQASRATSAAQSFFAPLKIERRYFTDGGVGYNTWQKSTAFIFYQDDHTIAENFTFFTLHVRGLMIGQIVETASTQ
jgi:hypothetical protein